MSASRAAKALALLTLLALAAAASAAAFATASPPVARAHVPGEGVEACTYFLTII